MVLHPHITDIPDWHPHPSMIVQFVTGALEGEQVGKYEKHINSCGVCSRTRSRIVREIDMAESDIPSMQDFQDEVWRRIRSKSS